MAPSSEVDHSIDYYELLAIPQSASEAEIRRAYRITSRLYHPDKVTPTPETLEKFQQLQHALALLTDPTERAKYDAGREAKLKRAAEKEMMDSRRRKMVEDLEKRESDARSSGGVNGVKRTWTDRELEMKRIQEENRRRREAVIARRTEEFRKAQVVEEPPSDDISRSVKVRWVKEGDGLDIDDQALVEMFPSGEVENAVLLKDKKRKVEGKGQKVVLGTALLVFKSVSAAKKAVAKGGTDELESIVWAVEKEQESERT